MSDSPKQSGRSIGRKIFDVLSGFGLATILLLLLLVLTWLGTLEQIDFGLHATLKKYFHPQAYWVVPEINHKTLPIILPGAYWVCAVLFFNLLLGGIVAARKGWNKACVLVAHASMLFLLVSAAVTHRYEKRGTIAIGEGETSNVAEDYFNWVLEISEMDGTKQTKVHVVDGKYLQDAGPGDIRTIHLPNLPFDLQVSRYVENAKPTSANEMAPANGEPIVDGYYLREVTPEKAAELNRPGVHVKILHRDGNTGNPFLMAADTFYPYTVNEGGKVFTVEMRKKLWALPYSLRLEKFTATFHPNTNRPEGFVSKVVRVEDGKEAPATIQMNEPLRYRGLTFFQASYGPPEAKQGDAMYSVFEVVENPADQWPRISIYIAGAAMTLHFIVKLVKFLSGSPGARSAKRAYVQSSDSVTY